MLTQDEVFNRLPLTADQKQNLYNEIMAEYHAEMDAIERGDEYPPALTSEKHVSAFDDVLPEVAHRATGQNEPSSHSLAQACQLDLPTDENQ